jgi:hypothetical protein
MEASNKAAYDSEIDITLIRTVPEIIKIYQVRRNTLM